MTFMEAFRKRFLQKMLVKALVRAVENDTNYGPRYKYVLYAVGLAAAAGYPVGIRMDPNEPTWPVVFIELPTGQVSWHMPQHYRAWDGHTTQEKFARIYQYVLKAELGCKDL